MKFCKDCAHHLPGYAVTPQVARCASPNNGINMITGETSIGFCSVNREYECGHDAKWFEPKTE